MLNEAALKAISCTPTTSRGSKTNMDEKVSLNVNLPSKKWNCSLQEVKSPYLSLPSEQTVLLTLANWDEVMSATFVATGGKEPTHKD